VNINWNIELLTVRKKFQTTFLPGHKIIIKNTIEIYVVYLSTKLAKLYEIIFTILNQSRGGNGIKLNTAKIILIIEKFIKNVMKALVSFKNISLIPKENILERINNRIIHIVAKTRFVAGHARATISSHFTGSL